MATGEPLFSVIVPTHHRYGFVQEAVRSVLTQSVEDFECIVIDDGNPDPIELPDDDRVRLVRRDSRGGAAAARNTGIAHARGRYLTFLDDDDLWTPDRLALALDGLERAPIALCYARSEGDDGATAINGRVLSGRVGDVILDERIPSVGQTAIARELAPLFDERFVVSEDVEWWVRAAQVGEVRTVPSVGYLIRHHDAPRQISRIDDRLRCRLLLLQEHASYFASHPRAARYQWKRAGGLASVLGDNRTARSAFWRSFRLGDRTALWHLLRSTGRDTAAGSHAEMRGGDPV